MPQAAWHTWTSHGACLRACLGSAVYSGLQNDRHCRQRHQELTLQLIVGAQLQWVEFDGTELPTLPPSVARLECAFRASTALDDGWDSDDDSEALLDVDLLCTLTKMCHLHRRACALLL